MSEKGRTVSVGRSEEETHFCLYVRNNISQDCVRCKITCTVSLEEFMEKFMDILERQFFVLFKKFA